VEITDAGSLNPILLASSENSIKKGTDSIYGARTGIEVKSKKKASDV